VPLVVHNLKGPKVKKTKTKKLEIKKVTLQNLDEPTLDAVAGGYPYTPPSICGGSCPIDHTCLKC
jgi:hypothetical protein